MNNKTLRNAIKEAKRFLAATDAIVWEDRGEFSFSPTKETAAAKRASMDLTRALADMRRSG